jgi:hypothetical protein
MDQGRKLIISIGLLLISSLATAVPSIGIADITTNGTSNSLPSFMQKDASDDSDNTTNALIQQQINNFSAQIRGNIIQSQQFRVVDVDTDITQKYANLSESSPENSFGQNISQNPSTTKTESPSLATNAKPLESAAIAVKPAQNQLPDYLLIGTLAAINAGEEINQIIGTNKYSNIYSIDIAVDYKLVRTQDQTIVASFTAAGHSGDVKLVNSQTQKVMHNIPLLVKQLGANLATDVSSMLSEQIGNGKLYLNSQESSPKVTDFKTYTD